MVLTQKDSLNKLANVGVLLILYNRVELAERRIKELEKIVGFGVQLFISIDAPKNADLESKHHEQIIALTKSSITVNRAAIFLEAQNQGCDKHIPRAIARVLDKCASVFVIEEDVSITPSALKWSLEKMIDITANGGMEPVIGMSGVFGKLMFKQNIWRKSPYFSPWGYGVNRKFWKEHTLLQNERLESPTIISKITGPGYFEKLSVRKQKVWLERCFRGNYDYAIQASMFQLNLSAMAPLVRIVDNEGFQIAGATHTRFKKPWFLKKPLKESSYRSYLDEIQSKYLQRILIYLDSVTWAGDSMLSKRGRSFGLRTVIKKRRLFNSNDHV